MRLLYTTANFLGYTDQFTVTIALLPSHGKSFYGAYRVGQSRARGIVSISATYDPHKTVGALKPVCG